MKGIVDGASDVVVVAISVVVPSVVNRSVVDVSSESRDVSVLLTDAVTMVLDSSFER